MAGCLRFEVFPHEYVIDMIEERNQHSDPIVAEFSNAKQDFPVAGKKCHVSLFSCPDSIFFAPRAHAIVCGCHTIRNVKKLSAKNGSHPKKPQIDRKSNIFQAAFLSTSLSEQFKQMMVRALIVICGSLVIY